MNDRMGLSLLLATPALTAVAQALLRAGMKDVTSSPASISSTMAQITLAFGHPSVFAGLLLYGLCSVLWVLLLGRYELSYAYPFVGLSFVFSLALSVAFLGEIASPMRIAGTLVIVVGVIMVASSR